MAVPTDIVTFHTSAQTWSESPHPLVGQIEPHTNLIPLFAASVRRSNPGARLVLLTDRRTVVPCRFDHVERAAVSQSELMLERFRLQRAWMRRPPFPRNIVFIDSDTLILGDMQSVFNEPFVLGVTVREVPRFSWEETAPYNAGVIFARASNNPRQTNIHDELIHRIKRMDPDYWAWNGNQLAMRDLIGRRKSCETISVCGVYVRVFSCSTHNYRPLGPNEVIDHCLILHFCGTAKPLMRIYAERFGLPA